MSFSVFARRDKFQSLSLPLKKYLDYLDVGDRVLVRLTMGRILPLCLALTSLFLWKQIQRLEGPQDPL
jgi:hypothetical protein